MIRRFTFYVYLCCSLSIFAQGGIERTLVFVKGFGTKFEVNRILSREYPIYITIDESIKRPSVWKRYLEGETDYNDEYSDEFLKTFSDSLSNTGYNVVSEINREIAFHNTFYLFQFDIREIKKENRYRIWMKMSSCTYNSSIDYEIGYSSYDTVVYIDKSFFLRNIDVSMLKIAENICTLKEEWEFWTNEEPTSTSLSKSDI
jgi:hypothetical protein